MRKVLAKLIINWSISWEINQFWKSISLKKSIAAAVQDHIYNQ